MAERERRLSLDLAQQQQRGLMHVVRRCAVVKRGKGCLAAESGLALFRAPFHGAALFPPAARYKNAPEARPVLLPNSPHSKGQLAFLPPGYHAQYQQRLPPRLA